MGRKQSKQSKNRKILIDNKYEKMPFLHVANSGTAEQYLSDVKEKKRKKRKENRKMEQHTDSVADVFIKATVCLIRKFVNIKGGLFFLSGLCLQEIKRERREERGERRERAAHSVVYGRVTLTLALINSLFLAHFLLHIPHFLPNQTVDWGVGGCLLFCWFFFFLVLGFCFTS